MGAMTGRTVWRSKILVLQQGDTMNALPVQVILISGDVVGRHQICVRVAAGAHLGDVRHVHTGRRVIGL